MSEIPKLKPKGVSVQFLVGIPGKSIGKNLKHLRWKSLENLRIIGNNCAEITKETPEKTTDKS